MLGGQLADGLDQVVAVARPLGDQLAQDEPPPVAGEHAPAAARAARAARAERAAPSERSVGAKGTMRTERSVGSERPLRAAEHRAPFAAGALCLAPGAVHVVIIAIVVHSEVLSRCA